jgi:hypothetical protein
MHASEGTTSQSDQGVAVMRPAAVALPPSIKITVERGGSVATIRTFGDDCPIKDHVSWRQTLANLESLPLPPSVQERDTV